MNAAIERHDEELLAAIPSFMSFGTLMKARPQEDGGRRLIFLEASNEDPDIAGEVVLQKALQESSSYYLRHGNVDLSHYTIMGPKAGIPNASEYEVGRPIAVRVEGAKTFVKAELYRGSSAMARNANMVWDSLTKQKPAARWYASVGGAVLAKSLRTDPKSRRRLGVVERVRWNNIALDRCPVNSTVPEISTAPLGMFAKSLGAWVITKSDGAGAALTAGYGTDSATLTGGAALRSQSLSPELNSYWAFRDRLSDDIRARRCGQTASAIVDHASQHYGLAKSKAADWAGRFLADLRSALTTRKT